MADRVLPSSDKRILPFRRALPAVGCLVLAACGTPEESTGPTGTLVVPPGTAPNAPGPITAGPETFVQIVGCLGAGDNLAIAACEDKFIADYAAATGEEPLSILDDLEAARKLDPNMEAACHPMSHAVGRWVYENDGTVVGSFSKCNEACHSGCYHGVMERVFEGASGDHATLEEIQTKMTTICDQTELTTPALEFQCLHGIGHAVMYSLSYDLNLALDTCNYLPNPTGPGSCQSAVFMENINAAIPELRDLDKNDPQYPCDAVDPKYARICYGMQTSVMFGYIGMTVPEVAEACRTGAGVYANTCFSSLGRDLSSYARTGQSEYLRQPCEDLAGEFADECLWGGIAALMDNTWDGSYAIPFCNFLHGDELRKTCYYQTHSHLKNAYLFDDTEWLNQCTLYAGQYIDVCNSQVPVPTTPAPVTTTPTTPAPAPAETTPAAAAPAPAETTPPASTTMPASTTPAN